MALDKKCDDCGFEFDRHHLKNGLCYACRETDDKAETCPNCNSGATGFSFGVMECFECEHEWKPKN